MDYKHLYFANPDPELDITDVLTTVKTFVKIDGTLIKWAHTIGDLGAEPESIDCTPLSSPVTLNKAGAVQQDNWTIDYYFNNADYDTLEGLKNKTEAVAITVTYDDGTVMSNTGKVAANYMSGHGTNAMLEAHAVIELSGEWKKTAAGESVG